MNEEWTETILSWIKSILHAFNWTWCVAFSSYMTWFATDTDTAKGYVFKHHMWHLICMLRGWHAHSPNTNKRWHCHASSALDLMSTTVALASQIHKSIPDAPLTLTRAPFRTAAFQFVPLIEFISNTQCARSAWTWNRLVVELTQSGKLNYCSCGSQ